ncbi:MAG: hypothetical protein ACTSYA_02360 [Candidatus Kariarchaeaceae archaeon]
MDRLEQLLILEDAWYKDRPTIARNSENATRLFKLLVNEVLELQEELEGGANVENIKRELADVGWFLFALFRRFDSDMFEEMREKIALNILRYDWKEFQNSDYNEARKKIKSKEKSIIREFYEEI